VTDIIERLRRPIVRINAEVALLCEAAIRAADEIERLRTELRDMRDRAEAAEEDAMPDDLARELDRLRNENGDRGNQIINLRRELADMSVISGIDDRYAGRLAFMLE